MHHGFLKTKCGVSNGVYNVCHVIHVESLQMFIEMQIIRHIKNVWTLLNYWGQEKYCMLFECHKESQNIAGHFNCLASE